MSFPLKKSESGIEDFDSSSPKKKFLVEPRLRKSALGTKLAEGGLTQIKQGKFFYFRSNTKF